MFENRHQPLLSRARYLRRQRAFAAVAAGFLAGGLLIGLLGYHGLEHLSWLDALLNAAMILGGMGPVNPLHTVAGKIFASCYALFAGLIYLVAAGILFAPLIHRMLHAFHAEIDKGKSASGV